MDTISFYPHNSCYLQRVYDGGTILSIKPWQYTQFLKIQTYKPALQAGFTGWPHNPAFQASLTILKSSQVSYCGLRLNLNLVLFFYKSVDELWFIKKCQTCTFKVNFRCQKSTEFFQKKTQAQAKYFVQKIRWPKPKPINEKLLLSPINLLIGRPLLVCITQNVIFLRFRGHSITTWKRRGRQVVSKMSRLTQVKKGWVVLM